MIDSAIERTAEMALHLPDEGADQVMYPLAPIGTTKAGLTVWPAFGAEGDDEEDADSELDDDTIDTGSGEADEEKEFTPPSEQEWKRTQAALARASAEAKRLRLRAKGEKPKEDSDVEKAAEAKFKPIAVRSAAKAALLEAGLNDVSDARMKRLLRQIDMDDVDVDEDGDVVGLEDQIEGIKEDFPELFEKKSERKRPTRLDASGRSSGGDSSKKSLGDRIAASVLG